MKKINQLLILIFLGAIPTNVHTKVDTGVLVGGLTAAGLVVGLGVYKLSTNPTLRMQLKELFNLQNYKSEVDPISLLPKNVQAEVNKAIQTAKTQMEKLISNKKTGLINESQKNAKIKEIATQGEAKTEYITAKANVKFVQKNSKLAVEEGTVTSSELTNAIEKYLKNGGSQEGVIKDLKVDAINFVDAKTGEPTISLNEWSEIFANVGIKDPVQLKDFTKSLAKLEPYKLEVAQFEYGQASQAFNTSLSQGLGLDKFTQGYENVYGKLQDMLVASGAQKAPIAMDEAYVTTGYEFALTDYVRHPELYTEFKGNAVDMLNKFRTNLGFKEETPENIFTDLSNLTAAQKSRIGAGNSEPFTKLLESIKVQNLSPVEINSDILKGFNDSGITIADLESIPSTGFDTSIIADRTLPSGNTDTISANPGIETKPEPKPIETAMPEAA